MRFGILQRYVLGEIFRAFALALLTITAVFVLLTVMGKAASVGLGPSEVAKLVPYMIPSSLPYTIPVSLLFAATVVYGRIASDNEVIAVKAAGQSAMILIWPAITLALCLSTVLTFLTSSAIPTATSNAKLAIFQNMEDLFYKKLKMERVFDVPAWPFLIRVKGVDGHVMKGALFKQRAEKPPEVIPLAGNGPPESGPAYSMIVDATEATIKFDFDHSKVRIYFKDAFISRSGVEPSEGIVRDTSFDFDIPNDKNGLFGGGNKMPEEMTIPEMRAKEDENRQLIESERKRQALAASWFIASGRLYSIDWKDLQAAYAKFDYWAAQITKYETEIQARYAMAWGSLFFVVLGAPVGILFARRDFLSAFISCFMPIILIYYPLMMFGMNLGKEGVIHPLMVWTGNAVLWVMAFLWAYPPVLKH